MSGIIVMNPDAVNLNQMAYSPGKLAQAFGISTMTLWRLRQDPNFPKPKVMPTGGKRFLVDEVKNYFQALPAAE